MGRRGIAILGGIAATVCFWPMARAAEIEINGGVATTVSVTDEAEPGTDADIGGDGRQRALTLAVEGYTGVRATGAKASAALDYSLGVSRSFGDETLEGTDFEHDLLALGNMELVPDWAFVDARASIQQQLTNPTGRIATPVDEGPGVVSSRGAVEDDQTQVGLIDISPYVVRNFGSTLQGEARYRYRHAFTDDDAVGDPQGQIGRVLLRTGSAFDRPAVAGLVEVENIWGGENAVGQPTDSPASADFDRFTGLARAQYPLVRGLFLIGSAGYEHIEVDSLRDDIDAPVLLGGVRFEPSPQTTFELTFGRRYDRWNTNAELSYEVTPSLVATAHYTEFLGTVFDSLDAPALAYDPTTGEILNLETGLTARLDATDLGLSSDAFFGRRMVAALTGNYDIQTFRVFTGYEERDYDFAADSTEWRLGAEYSRQLGRSVNGSLGVTYRNAEVESDDNSIETLLFGAAVDYEIRENIALRAFYYLTRNLSGGGNDWGTSNVIGISLVTRFSS